MLDIRFVMKLDYKLLSPYFIVFYPKFINSYNITSLMMLLEILL